MLSSGTLYTTLALMAIVATACTALCLVWSVPAWRGRLAPTKPMSDLGLFGWPARIGSGLVSGGIGAVALAAWYGAYCCLIAL